MLRTPAQKEAARLRRERRARGEYKQSIEVRAKKSGKNNHNYGKPRTDDTRAKISKAQVGKPNHMQGKHHTEMAKAKISKTNSGRHHTDGAKTKLSRANSGENSSRYGKHQSSEVCKKIGESLRKTWLDKQWYRTVTYRDPERYCVTFNFEFKERCRAYWENKSVLSHKTQAENCIIHGKPARLTVHHVYYQPKACCGYDEDLEGYYAMINLGTERKPHIVRHNIKGDPNKFVILTATEHGEIQSDKLTRIKEFEDLIEEQGGKCYLTKEEMVEYKKSVSNPPLTSFI